MEVVSRIVRTHTPASTLVMSSTLMPANGRFEVSAGVARHLRFTAREPYAILDGAAFWPNSRRVLYNDMATVKVS